eukprot:1186822-Prorocentrum_minimum.AAC.1
MASTHGNLGTRIDYLCANQGPGLYFSQTYWRPPKANAAESSSSDPPAPMWLQRRLSDQNVFARCGIALQTNGQSMTRVAVCVLPAGWERFVYDGLQGPVFGVERLCYLPERFRVQVGV